MGTVQVTDVIDHKDISWKFWILTADREGIRAFQNNAPKTVMQNVV